MFEKIPFEPIPENPNPGGNENVEKEPHSLIQFSPDQWQDYRQIVLESLENDPASFGGNLEEDSKKDESYWKDRLEDPNRALFGIKVEGKIVASAGLKQRSDGALWLRTVYVSPEMRGKGLSKELVERCLEEAKRRGAKKVQLEVTAEQTPAVRLYEKFGFSEYGRKENKTSDGEIREKLLMEMNIE